MITGTLKELSKTLKFENATLAKKRQILIDIHGSHCMYCGASADYFEVDHVHPVCRGGTDELTNLVLSCVDCNQMKGGAGFSQMHNQPSWLKDAVMRTLQQLSPFSNRKFTYNPAKTNFHLNGSLPIKYPSKITEFGELIERHRIQSGFSKKGILKRLNSFEKKWNNYLTNVAIFGESQLPGLAKLLSIPLGTLENAYIKNCFDYALERPLLSQVWKKPFLQEFIESCDIESRIKAFLDEYPEKIKSIHPCYPTIQNLKIGRPPGKTGRDRMKEMLGFEVFPAEKIEAFRQQLKYETPNLKQTTIPQSQSRPHTSENGKSDTSTPPVWVAPPLRTEAYFRKLLHQELDYTIKNAKQIKHYLSSPEIKACWQPVLLNFKQDIQDFVAGRSFTSVAKELGISTDLISSYCYGHTFPTRKYQQLLKEKAGIDVYRDEVLSACHDLIDIIPMTDKGDIRVESIRRLKKEGLFYSEGIVTRDSIGMGRKIFASWESEQPTPKVKRWTAEEDNQLRELFKQGKTDKEIGAVLGRPKEGVRQRRKNKLGLDYRKHWSAEEEAQLKQLLTKTDKPLSEIAEIMGRTKGSIQRRKEHLGIRRIPVKLDKHNPMHLEQVLKYKAAGWTQAEIAEVYGLKNPAQISSILRFHGFHRYGDCRHDTQWTELETHRLRKRLEKGTPRTEIYKAFPHRSEKSVCRKIEEITRYWLSPAEQAKRRKQRENHMKWRVY